MKKDSITQFVCFITSLKSEEFFSSWEGFAKLVKADTDPMLLQFDSNTKSRYRFISQHDGDDQNFRFAFMKGRNSEHFPDHKVKVVQAGGYLPLQVQYRPGDNSDVTIIALVDHSGPNIESFRELTPYKHLNIYQAYFESCTYGYILQYGTAEKNVEELLNHLKARTDTEAAVYKECLVNA